MTVSHHLRHHLAGLEEAGGPLREPRTGPRGRKSGHPESWRRLPQTRGSRPNLIAAGNTPFQGPAGVCPALAPAEDRLQPVRAQPGLAQPPAPSSPEIPSVRPSGPLSSWWAGSGRAQQRAESSKGRVACQAKPTSHHPPLQKGSCRTGVRSLL